MIHCEFQNIKELETNEACETSEATVMSYLNEFLLNISSDQIKIPVKFNS